jgi:hypothetical protein
MVWFLLVDGLRREEVWRCSGITGFSARARTIEILAFANFHIAAANLSTTSNTTVASDENHYSYQKYRRQRRGTAIMPQNECKSLPGTKCDVVANFPHLVIRYHVAER